MAVGALLAVDFLLLVIWTIVDPLTRDVHNFPKVASDDPEADLEFQPQLEHCKSKHHSVWLGKPTINPSTSITCKTLPKF